VFVTCRQKAGAIDTLVYWPAIVSVWPCNRLGIFIGDAGWTLKILSRGGESEFSSTDSSARFPEIFTELSSLRNLNLIE
jgi:hypothetical protein